MKMTKQKPWLDGLTKEEIRSLSKSQIYSLYRHYWYYTHNGKKPLPPRELVFGERAIVKISDPPLHWGGVPVRLIRLIQPVPAEKLIRAIEGGL
jgi:hypothetical protein